MAEIGPNMPVFVIEETAAGAGIHEALAWRIHEKLPHCAVYGKDLGPEYITHGSLKDLYRRYGLDGQSICDYVQEVLSVEG